MKRKINFYTDQQNQTLVKELHKGGKISDLSRKYSALWSRSQGSLYVKLLKMQRNPTSTRVAKKGIELPKGWSFDIANVKRVVLHNNNSVTLYF
jgi:hypothetical protein